MTETIPEAALNTHVGVLGRTGSGKTFTARGLVERLLDRQRQVVIIDPTGAWWGLRSHYAVPVFGGDHGDVAITEESGEAVARTILDNSTSAIVDLSLLARQSGSAMRRFMRSFVARLKDKPNGAIWLVIDEADEFLPQTIPGGMEGLFGDLKWLVRRGRVAGWRVMMITQRPQDIAKSVLTQIGTLVAHRLTAPQDRKAIEEWVKGHADPDAAKQVLSTLAGLQTGEAWVWWPDGDVLVRGQMPLIRSFDSSATPDAGTGAIVQPALTAINMSAIRATLEAGKSDSQKPSVTKSDNNRLLDAQAEIDRLLSKNADLIRANAECANLFTEQLDQINAMADLAEKIIAIAKEIPAYGAGQADPDAETGCADDRLPGSAEQWRDAIKESIAKGARRSPARFSLSAIPKPAQEGHPSLNAAARKMIEMLDRIAPAKVPWGSLAAMVGNKASGGNFNTARKAMRESGLIIEDGNAVRSAKPPADGLRRDQAFALWSDVLSNPAPRMMIALKEHGSLTKPQIGEELGIAPRGGNFNNGIAQLIRNGVVVDRGGLLSLADPLPGESK